MPLKKRREGAVGVVVVVATVRDVEEFVGFEAREMLP